MKALRCNRLEGPESLAIEEIPTPPVGPDDICVDVHAASLNFFDNLMCRGKYQFQPPLPFTPGAEAAGIVSAVGSAVTRFRVGDRVATSAQTGAFAEQMVTPADSAFAVPDGLDLGVAAGIRAVYGTSYYGITERGQLKPGENLLVNAAAGGVGLAAVDIGRMIGARVIGAVGSESKAEIVRAYGADAVINYEADDLRDDPRALANRIKELTGGKGVDVVYDPVGGKLFEPCLRSMNWYGRYLVIGFVDGIPNPPMNLVLLKSCAITGVFWGAWVARNPEGNRRMMAEIFDHCSAGRLKPHIGLELPLDRAVEGMVALEQRQTTGKVIFRAR